MAFRWVEGDAGAYFPEEGCWVFSGFCPTSLLLPAGSEVVILPRGGLSRGWGGRLEEGRELLQAHYVLNGGLWEPKGVPSDEVVCGVERFITGHREAQVVAGRGMGCKDRGGGPVGEPGSECVPCVVSLGGESSELGDGKLMGISQGEEAFRGGWSSVLWITAWRSLRPELLAVMSAFLRKLERRVAPPPSKAQTCSLVCQACSVSPCQPGLVSAHSHQSSSLGVLLGWRGGGGWWRDGEPRGVLVLLCLGWWRVACPLGPIW